MINRLQRLSEEELQLVQATVIQRQREKQIAAQTARRLRRDSAPEAIAFSAFSRPGSRPSTTSTQHTDDSLNLIRKRIRAPALRVLHTHADEIPAVPLPREMPIDDTTQASSIVSPAASSVVFVATASAAENGGPQAAAEVLRPPVEVAPTMESEPPRRKPPIPFRRKHVDIAATLANAEAARVARGLPRESGVERRRAPHVARRCRSTQNGCQAPRQDSEPKTLTMPTTSIEATARLVGPAIPAGTGVTWHEEALMLAIARTNVALQSCRNGSL
jgi:hypothetical protein